METRGNQGGNGSGWETGRNWEELGENQGLKREEIRGQIKPQELGGTWRNWEELGGTGRNSEELGGNGGKKIKLGETGGTRRNWEELGGTGRNLEELGGTWRKLGVETS